jgi:uncharacterized protein YdbL (DUF1318 family)
MTTYRLKDDGYPTFKKITSGRKQVGRVCKTKDGYLGIIGKTEYKGSTERETFDGVVAKHCGFDSAADMSNMNREIRAINRVQRAKFKHVADEMLSGNFEPLDRLMGFKK